MYVSIILCMYHLYVSICYVCIIYMYPSVMYVSICYVCIIYMYPSVMYVSSICIHLLCMFHLYVSICYVCIIYMYPSVMYVWSICIHLLCMYHLYVSICYVCIIYMYPSVMYVWSICIHLLCMYHLYVSIYVMYVSSVIYPSMLCMYHLLYIHLCYVCIIYIMYVSIFFLPNHITCIQEVYYQKFSTRRLQIFQCVSMAILFLNCSKWVWLAVFVDDTIKLAYVLLGNQNWINIVFHIIQAISRMNDLCLIILVCWGHAPGKQLPSPKQPVIDLSKHLLFDWCSFPVKLWSHWRSCSYPYMGRVGNKLGPCADMCSVQQQ